MALGIYDGFADFYARGPYIAFGDHLVEALEVALEVHDCRPEAVLDLACGQGGFASLMAARGYRVTGVDRSPRMLHHARRRAQREGVQPTFCEGDIRELAFDRQFELVTCWFDSLNYLLTRGDLIRAFEGAYRALRPGGLFVFDMNTIHGLAVLWQQYPNYVQQDHEDLLEVHFPSYDHEEKTATLRIVGFWREDQIWHRMEETHREKGYSMGEIEDSLRWAGFHILARWGSLAGMLPVTETSGRVWYVARRPVD